MRNWYIADPHFLHKNIIRYTGRPFKTLKEMTSTIVNNVNKVVKPDDTVYWIGDFAMAGRNGLEPVKSLLQRMNGHHVLILGNHDEMKPFMYIDAGFWSVHTSLEIEEGAHSIVLNHDPCVKCIIPNNKIFVHGHTHNLYKSIPSKQTVCVCVENWNYTPVSIGDILDELIGGEDGKEKTDDKVE